MGERAIRFGRYEVQVELEDGPTERRAKVLHVTDRRTRQAFTVEEVGLDGDTVEAICRQAWEEADAAAAEAGRHGRRRVL